MLLWSSVIQIVLSLGLVVYGLWARKEAKRILQRYEQITKPPK